MNTENPNVKSCEGSRELSCHELVRQKARHLREYSVKLDELADTLENARMSNIAHSTLRNELLNVRTVY